jgi:hypothetical protein
VAQKYCESGQSGLDAIFFTVMGTKALSDELFPAISILGLSRIRIVLFKRRHIGFGLLVLRINARRGSVKVLFDIVEAGCLQRVDVNQRVVV